MPGIPCVFKTVRCPDCGGDVVVYVDPVSEQVLDYHHVTPACPTFARRSYDDNARRLAAA
jgi:hypothetical protein